MEQAKTIKNCFECTGGIEMSHCPLYAPLVEGELCTYRQVADNDLKKYNEGSGMITFGKMLKEFIASHPELKKAEIGKPFTYILGSERGVRPFEEAAQRLHQPAQSYISLDMVLLEIERARAIIIHSPLDDRSPEGKLLTTTPVDGVYAALAMQTSGYKGKIYVFGKTSSQPQIANISFYPEGPQPELIDECFRLIAQAK